MKGNTQDLFTWAPLKWSLFTELLIATLPHSSTLSVIDCKIFPLQLREESSSTQDTSDSDVSLHILSVISICDEPTTI